MSGALQGVKVLEIGSYVTGPYAGMLLGDLGAEVIKVENKPYGDPFRGWGRTVLNPTFCSLNRNKKSITLNLKTVEAQGVFLELAGPNRGTGRHRACSRPGLLYQASSLPAELRSGSN